CAAHSRERESFSGQRQGSYAMADCVVDGITDRGRNGWQRGLANARRWKVALNEMHLDFRSVRNAQQWIAVKVGLRDAPVLDVELEPHRGAEAIDHAAFDLILCPAKV